MRTVRRLSASGPTRGLLPLLLATAVVAGCGGGTKALPAGTFAGSTATDQPFVVEIGSSIKVNRRSARIIDGGVLQVRGGAVPMTLDCAPGDRKGESLRCTVRTMPPQGSPTTEVIDLMLL